MERILAIAYGHPLRSDDGIGCQAAAGLRRELPSVERIMCIHQLTPGLADLEPHSFHALPPAEVLEMCVAYSVKARAFLISVDGGCFDHGQELPPSAIHAGPSGDTHAQAD